jgi:hypothetical protein
MSVAPMMLSFVEDELSRAPSLIGRTVATALSQLQPTSKPDQTSRADKQLRTEVFEGLQRGSRLFTQVFTDSLRTLVMADASMQAQQAMAESSPETAGFQLLDENRIETDIEISRAAQAIDLAAEWELRELQTFTSALLGQAHVSVSSNPLRPAVYSQALWDAACAITSATAQRQLLFRTATACLARQLKMAWASASTRLESQGIEPSVYRTTVHAPSPAAASGAVWSAQPAGLGQLLGRMPAARSGGGVPAGQTAAEARGSAAQAQARFSATFEDVLQRIEALLGGGAEYQLQLSGSARSGAQPLHGLVGSLLAHASDVIDRQIVELLSRLFEAILCDEQLSSGVRAVMARLQVSALRVALTDPEMLDNDRHPVWRLMNRIAQAAQLWPEDADPRAASLLAFNESLAADIAATERPTAELYLRALAQLEEHLDAQLQAQRKAAQSVIDALALGDRREMLRVELSAQFSEQFRSSRASPGVLAFMTEAWPRVVTESILRFGADSEHTAAYLQAADDLDVSLNLQINPKNRLQLFSLLPRLLKRLRAGMALIALPLAEQQAMLDDLMVAHTSLLGFATTARGLPGEADFKSSSPIGASGVSEQLPPAEFGESLIDVHSMDTVPAELLSTVEGAQTMPAELTETVIMAAPCEWFLRGRWQRVQLLWRSESARTFLFAGEAAGCLHSITGDALQRLGREGLIKPLSETGLLQRAVDRVGRKLTDAP